MTLFDWKDIDYITVKKRLSRSFAAGPWADDKNGYVKVLYKDLYISVYDMNGNVVSHPYNKGLIGKNLINIQDPDGKMFIKEFVDKAAKSPSGYVEYKYTHPQTKKVEPKTAYFERVGNLIIQVGAYK